MPLEPSLRLGVVTFQAPGLDARRVVRDLYENHRIWVERKGDRIRFSPHIYNSAGDVEMAASAVLAMAGSNC